MGVSLALKKLDATVHEIDDSKRVRTLGPIIHNPQVLAAYKAKGVAQIQSPEESKAGDEVVIRAHGIPRTVEQRLCEQGVKIVDATCPKVKKAQLLIEKQTERGRTLLLYGEADHPEVKGLLSYANKDAIVFDSLEEIQGKLRDDVDYFLAAQTTQDKAVFDQIRRYAQSCTSRRIPVLETICDATKVRQQEAIAIAKSVDRMVVVGGYTSGNTRRLAKVCQEQGTKTVHVETAEELNPDDFSGCETVGLTAGASTHDNTIEEIRARLEKM